MKLILAGVFLFREALAGLDLLLLMKLNKAVSSWNAEQIGFYSAGILWKNPNPMM